MAKQKKREPAFLTPAEAAEIINVKEWTVRRWAQTGVLPFRRIGKRMLFDEVELRAYARDHLGKQPQPRNEVTGNA